MKLIDELSAIYRSRGDGAYFGEPVTVTEHCLQAAHFATLAAVPESLIVAALLHDIGHLVEAVPDDIADWTEDARHELVGSRWLARHFGPAVSEPVRLHVPAKRYLCATDPTYFSKLSPASVRTLELQGGPMRAAEIGAFEAEPYSRDALLVRRCDDQGKVAGLDTAGFDSYRAMIERLVTPAGRR
ncbi:MAG: HD domain-containing protein [Steroidobacteraceae bacterium]